MKVTLNLEVQEGDSLLERIHRLLIELGAEVGAILDGKFSGNLPDDGAYFVFHPARQGFTDIGAEHSGLTWKVGVRGTFYSTPQESVASP